MNIVIDASAAVQIAMNSKISKTVKEKLVEADTILAPVLFVSEVVNTLWKYHQFEQMPLEQCGMYIDLIIRLPDMYVSEIDFYQEAFALANSTKKTVYDMIYLVLARRNNAYLATIDKSLRQTALHQSIQVI